MNSHVCVLHFRSGSGSAQLYNSMLTVYLEPASTSQLSSLSTAHSSWRYTATVGPHPHCLRGGPRPGTCHNIWRVFKFRPWGIRWWSTQAGWYSCAGVWWAQHIPYYIALGCMSIDNVLMRVEQVPNWYTLGSNSLSNCVSSLPSPGMCGTASDMRVNKGDILCAVQLSILLATKPGHENGLGMRLMKWCNNWISQPLMHSQYTL